MTITKLTLNGPASVEFPAGLEAKASPKLVTQYVQYIQAVTTQKGGHTKTRGEVSGGGAKPWRQKGTGRARVGSSRSPIWRGGGITFGPRSNENGDVRMPKKMRQLALRTLITEAVADGRLMISDFKAEDEGKQIRKIVSEATATHTRRVLVVTDADTTLKPARNLAGSESVNLDHFGAKQLLGRSGIVIEEPVFTELVKRYSK